MPAYSDSTCAPCDHITKFLSVNQKVQRRHRKDRTHFRIHTHFQALNATAKWIQSLLLYTYKKIFWFFRCINFILPLYFCHVSSTILFASPFFTVLYYKSLFQVLIWFIPRKNKTNKKFESKTDQHFQIHKKGKHLQYNISRQSLQTCHQGLVS